MIRDTFVKTEKSEKDKLAEILKKEEGPRKQTMIEFKDMEFLLGLLEPETRAENISLNKKAGLCYSHTINYEGRLFFNTTGSEIIYHHRKNTFAPKHVTKNRFYSSKAFQKTWEPIN